MIIDDGNDTVVLVFRNGVYIDLTFIWVREALHQVQAVLMEDLEGEPIEKERIMVTDADMLLDWLIAKRDKK